MESMVADVNSVVNAIPHIGNRLTAIYAVNYVEYVIVAIDTLYIYITCHSMQMMKTQAYPYPYIVI